jgi:hypothetical protein
MGCLHRAQVDLPAHPRGLLPPNNLHIVYSVTEKMLSWLGTGASGSG